MDNETRNSPTKYRNYQMMELIRQQISNLILQYPELEEDEQLRSDMMEGSTDAFEFLHQLELQRQEVEDLINGNIDRVSELQQRRVRFERREEALRRLMFNVMQVAHVQKAEFAEATLSIRSNSPKVIVTDESQLELPYWRIKREVDKTKIKQDLNAGITVVGAELSNAEPVLAIRTK